MTTSKPTDRRPLRTVGWTLFFLFAAAMAIYAVSPYLSGDPARSAIELNIEFDRHFFSLVLHGIFGGTAMILGPLQFVPAVRRRFPKYHRIAGRVYMGAVLVGACVSLYSASISISGFDVQVAFTLLAFAWIYTLVQGYRSIRRGDVAQHRVWMIRNYALTFAAFTLRLILIGGGIAGDYLPWLEPGDVYRIAAWGSFIINVVIAEYFIIHRIGRKTIHESAPAVISAAPQ